MLAFRPAPWPIRVLAKVGESHRCHCPLWGPRFQFGSCWPASQPLGSLIQFSSTLAELWSQIPELSSGWLAVLCLGLVMTWQASGQESPFSVLLTSCSHQVGVSYYHLFVCLFFFCSSTRSLIVRHCYTTLKLKRNELWIFINCIREKILSKFYSAVLHLW